ncbi:MAG: hypothetical protein LVQ64_00235 [Thermoplasmatales archaeon]|nr:hypothetical protein [Thermoplasmatales archaeon]
MRVASPRRSSRTQITYVSSGGSPSGQRWFSRSRSHRGGRRAAEELDEMIVASSSEERSSVAGSGERLEYGGCVVGEAAHDGRVHDDAIDDPGGLGQIQDPAQPFESLARGRIQTEGGEALEERTRFGRAHAHSYRTEQLVQIARVPRRKTRARQFREELLGRALAKAVDGMEVRGRFPNPSSSPDPLGESPVIDAERVEPLGSAAIEHRGGGREDLDLGRS